MAYRKVPAETRACAFCGTAFVAAHRRRIYCSDSCNTRACLARKVSQPAVPAAAGLAAPTEEPVKVTLASNLQNWTMLAVAPHAQKIAGVALQVLGDLFTPPTVGPATWLPAALRQTKGPLVALTHASWDEPRFFVELPYAGHTLYYRAQHELLVVREPAGSLRQICTAAEFAALTPVARQGIAALQAQYETTFSPPLHAPQVAPLLPNSLPLRPGQEREPEGSRREPEST